MYCHRCLQVEKEEKNTFGFCVRRRRISRETESNGRSDQHPAELSN